MYSIWLALCLFTDTQQLFDHMVIRRNSRNNLIQMCIFEVNLIFQNICNQFLNDIKTQKDAVEPRIKLEAYTSNWQFDFSTWMDGNS